MGWGERERGEIESGRDGAASRNNVTQLKIQYADVVVYQMEIHTRISLSAFITMVFYGSRERVLNV